MFKIRYEISGKIVYFGDYWDCKETMRLVYEDDENYYIEDPNGYAVA